MTASVWAAIGSWGAIATSLFIGAFVYGKLTQKVSDVVEDVRDAKSDIRDLKITREEHGRDLVRIKTHLKLHDYER